VDARGLGADEQRLGDPAVAASGRDQGRDDEDRRSPSAAPGWWPAADASAGGGRSSQGRAGRVGRATAGPAAGRAARGVKIGPSSPGPTGLGLADVPAVRRRRRGRRPRRVLVRATQGPRVRGPRSGSPHGQLRVIGDVLEELGARGVREDSEGEEEDFACVQRACASCAGEQEAHGGPSWRADPHRRRRAVAGRRRPARRRLPPLRRCGGSGGPAST
jgi:hypothetical protein